MSPRVLVTGGTGFLGRGVVHALQGAGYHTTTLSRHTDADLVADLADVSAVRAALTGEQFDAVCHLAARTSGHESRTDPLGYWTANLTGTVNLLAMILPGTPVVLASSAAVYAGDATGALDEDTPAKPGNPYGASKHAAEEVARAWSATTDSPLTVLRCFNIAGAVDGHGDPDRRRIIPAIIDAAAGRAEAFTLNGDGSTVRDYCHVLDVADAFALAVAEPAPGQRTFNVGTGDGLSIAQLLDAAKEVIGHAVPIHQAPARPEAARLVADPRRIYSALGWVPTRSSAKNLVRDEFDAIAGGA